ncbi:MAG: hypothetical protein QMB47_00040 [Bacteroidales bacterium]
MKKYLEELHKLKLFRLKDIVDLSGNESSAKDLLQSYKKQRLICHIRRDLYSVTDLASKIHTANKFEIASKITDSSYLSYHSALEYHGLAHQVFYDIYVSSNKKFKSFEFDEINYLFCQPKIDLGVTIPSADSLIRITDLERTVVDCIDRIDRSGGIEELVKCFSLITFLNEEKLLKYLDQYSKQFLYQKAGFILQYFKNETKISKNVFDLCKRKIGMSTRYLTDPQESDTYFAEWKICAPANILLFLEQGGTANV